MEPSALSSPSSPVHHPHPFESAETSELEEGPLADDDGSNPPPPSSSGSPSHLIPLSGYPTPTVRYLIYGGPNGIFRDANASILQHMQASTSDTIIPEAPTPQQAPVTTQVKEPFLLLNITLHTPQAPPASVTIDLTGDSDGEDGNIPTIDPAATQRAEILKGFLTSQGDPPFLRMVESLRARRDSTVASQLPKDEEVERMEASGVEDDSASTKTHESSMEDADVSFLLLFISNAFAHLLTKEPVTLHHSGQAHQARLWSAHFHIFWDYHQ